MRIITLILFSGLMITSCSVKQREAVKKPAQFPGFLNQQSIDEGQTIILLGSRSMFFWPEGLPVSEEVTVKKTVIDASRKYDLFIKSYNEQGTEKVVLEKELKKCKDDEELNSDRCKAVQEELTKIPKNEEFRNQFEPQLTAIREQSVMAVGEPNWIVFKEPKDYKNIESFSYIKVEEKIGDSSKHFCKVKLWGISDKESHTYSNDRKSCLDEMEHGPVLSCVYDSKIGRIKIKIGVVDWVKTESKCYRKSDCSEIILPEGKFCKTYKEDGVTVGKSVSEYPVLTGAIFELDLEVAKFVDQSHRFSGLLNYRGMTQDEIEVSLTYSKTHPSRLAIDENVSKPIHELVEKSRNIIPRNGAAKFDELGAPYVAQKFIENQQE